MVRPTLALAIRSRTPSARQPARSRLKFARAQPPVPTKYLSAQPKAKPSVPRYQTLPALRAQARDRLNYGKRRHLIRLDGPDTRVPLPSEEYTYKPTNYLALKGIVPTTGGYRGLGGRFMRKRYVFQRPQQIPTREDVDPKRQSQREQFEKSRLKEVTVYGEERKVPHPHQRWIHPTKRIRQASIFPGDTVRLRSGLDEYKYEEITVEGETWKVPRVIKVSSIMPSSNRLKLDLPRTPVDKPDNWESLSSEAQQAWEQQNVNKGKTISPVDFGNVDLCLYEDPAKTNHVFAKRLKTGPLSYDRSRQHWVWSRYAIGTTGSLPEGLERKFSTDGAKLRIPWPTKPFKPYKDYPEPNMVSGTAPIQAREKTLLLPADLTQALALVSDSSGNKLFPTTTQSPRPTDVHGSDLYISALRYSLPPTTATDAFMPLHLADELAPRFAKHKRENLYRARKDAKVRAREQAGIDAIAEWQLNGCDKNLRRVMDQDEVGLEGVPIRPRSRKEVLEIALREFDANEKKMKKQLNFRREKLGLRWDYEFGAWVEGPRALVLVRKGKEKKKRLVAKARELREMKLEPKKNMVVPEWLRKAPAEKVAST